MRISDWSSDVCSSDLPIDLADDHLGIGARPEQLVAERGFVEADCVRELFIIGEVADELRDQRQVGGGGGADGERHGRPVSMGGAAVKSAFARTRSRSEEHTSELQSLMRI